MVQYTLDSSLKTVTTYLGVLLNDANSFLKEIRKDSDAVFLGNKHDEILGFNARRIFYLKHENRLNWNAIAEQPASLSSSRVAAFSRF
jgi:hypothetical protein